MNNAYLISQSTTDWKTSMMDPGVRYHLHSSDNGTFGVSTVVVDANQRVHLYYMGDMHAVNNIRHALSIDGGDTFTFQSNDVCGDFNGIGTQYSHLDPFALLLNDNRIRIYTVNANGTIVPPTSAYQANWNIYSFISSDNGMTFTQEMNSNGNDTLVKASFFADANVRSLHDPKAVQLPDGRIKVFMNGSTFPFGNNLVWDIYSVTSLPPVVSSTKDKQKQLSFSISPNPARDLIHITSNERIEKMEILSFSGKRILQTRENNMDISNLKSGIYLLKVHTQGGFWDIQKLVIQ